MPSTIISCAVTGSAPTPDKNPAVPVTPLEIANSAIGAARAGAAIVHCHVRSLETKKTEYGTRIISRSCQPDT